MHGSHGDAAGELCRTVQEGQDGLNKTNRYSRTLGPAKERAGGWSLGGEREVVAKWSRVTVSSGKSVAKQEKNLASKSRPRQDTRVQKMRGVLPEGCWRYKS